MTEMQKNPSTPEDGFPRPVRWSRMLPAFGAMVLAFALMPWAESVHAAVYELLMRLPLSEFFSTSKQFASTTCLVSLLAGIWLLDPRRQRMVIVLLLTLALSTLINESIKQITGRARPAHSVLLDAKDMKKTEKYIREHPGTPVRAERTDQWLLFKSHRPWFKDDFSSFPSGHSNTAFILAAFLLILYPRGRWIWLILAVGCALARVRFRRHFTEDILFGGALGWLFAQWVLSWGWPFRLADWLLSRLGTRFR